MKSTFVKLVNFVEIIEGRKFGVVNQEKNKAAQMGLVHLGGPYYGPTKGKPATHIGVRRNPDDPNEVPDIRPMSEKEKAASKSDTEPETSDTSRSGGPSPSLAPRQAQQLTLSDKIMKSTVSGEVPENQQAPLRHSDVERVLTTRNKTKKDATLTRAMKKRQMREQNRVVSEKNKLRRQAKKPELPLPFSDVEFKESGGLGTPLSQAGECATVGCLQELRNQFFTDTKSDVQRRAHIYVDTYFANLEQDRQRKEGTPEELLLTKSWIVSSHAQVKTILSEFGVDNIRDVVWDTPEGRHLLGTEGHRTSADIFLLTKNNKCIGISLKKNGKVSIANRGIGAAVDDLLIKFQQAKLPVSEQIKFRDTFSTAGVYKKELNDSMIAAQRHMLRTPEYKAAMISAIEKFKKYPKLDTNISNYINDANVNAIFSNSPVEFTGDQQTLFSRLHQHLSYTSPDVKIKNDAYDIYRSFYSPRHKMNRRLINFLSTNTIIDDSMKDYILDNAHIYELLGLGLNKQLDSLVVAYGGSTPDSGAMMNAQRLLEFFSVDDPSLESHVRAARAGDSAAAERVKKIITDRIRLDYSSGKRGEVRYCRRNPTGGPPVILDYTLFDVELRVRGIGEPPSLLIIQNSGLTTALMHGVDMDSWPDKIQQKYYRSHYISLMEHAENASSEDSKKIKAEMNVVRQKFNYTPKFEATERAKLDIKLALEESDD